MGANGIGRVGGTQELKLQISGAQGVVDEIACGNFQFAFQLFDDKMDTSVFHFSLLGPLGIDGLFFAIAESNQSLCCDTLSD